MAERFASADNTDLAFDNSWYHVQPYPIIVYDAFGLLVFFLYLYIGSRVQCIVV